MEALGKRFGVPPVLFSEVFRVQAKKPGHPLASGRNSVAQVQAHFPEVDFQPRGVPEDFG